jgi:Serine/threonine protein kinase
MNYNAIDIPGHSVVHKIGEGGVGTVYLATDDMLQRHVAVKVLKSGISLEEENMKRFQSEAVTLARLRHPNITMLYNLVQNRGCWYMIMEYVDGETLESLLKKHGSLHVTQVLPIALQTLEGLQHAHAKGVIHRDIKPSNLMLSVEGEVKIMDFGIARISGGSRLTKVGQAVGTPHYMSPEQVRGQEGNHASDIYSFGIVLYELLTGVTPFDSESEYEIMHAHTSRKPIPPSALNNEIPEALNNAIMKALSKNPLQRFESVSEFKQCLQQISEQVAAGSTVTKPVTRISLPWKLPAKISLPKISSAFKALKMPENWKLPAGIDRQYVLGISFLAISLITAIILVFYYSGPESNELANEVYTENNLPVIEVEPDTDMGKIMHQSQAYTGQTEPAQNFPDNLASDKNKDPIKNTPPVQDKKTDKSKPASTTETKKNTPAKTDKDTKEKKQEQDATKEPPEQKKPVEKPVVTPPEEKPVIVTTEKASTSAALDKSVVVPRGTKVDLIMDGAYDYESTKDKSRVTLTVAEPVMRSGVIIIAAGAKASAILHKNNRLRSLEIELVDVESVTGKKLPSLRTTYKAATIQPGTKFKMTLDYSRLEAK